MNAYDKQMKSLRNVVGGLHAADKGHLFASINNSHFDLTRIPGKRSLVSLRSNIKPKMEKSFTDKPVNKENTTSITYH